LWRHPAKGGEDIYCPTALPAKENLFTALFDIKTIQWSCTSEVNFITKLFSHRPHAEDPARATSWAWGGQSGRKYQYDIYPLDASFKSLPGLYIYAKQLEDGDWIPIYISQTRDLHQRLEGHVRMSDAMAAGATSLHAHYSDAGQGVRHTEEKDIIARWQPVCNDVAEN
jgi:hypothetical protein